MTRFSQPLEALHLVPRSSVLFPPLLASTPLHSCAVTSNSSQQQMLLGAGAKAVETEKRRRPHEGLGSASQGPAVLPPRSQGRGRLRRSH